MTSQAQTYVLLVQNQRHPMELKLVEKMCRENKLSYELVGKKGRTPEIKVTLGSWTYLEQIRSAIQFMTTCSISVLGPGDERDQT